MIGIALALSVLLGVLLADTGGGALAAALLALAGSAIIVARRDRKTVLLVTLAGALIAFGAWRVLPPAESAESAAVAVPRSAFDVTGVVIDRPRRYPNATIARLRLSEPVELTVEAVLPPYPRVDRGDVLRLAGRLVPSEQADPRAPGSRPAYRLVASSVEIRGSVAGPADRAQRWLADRIEASVLRNVPEPAAALVLGVMTGDDRGMTRETRRVFREAGLTHLTAVSGWNVALVTGVVTLLSSRLPIELWARMALCVGAVWAYAFLVGAEPSVQRAAVMATAYLVARLRGRPADTLAALVWAVALIILVDPPMRLEPGFQLSVAATLAIAWIIPWLRERSLWWGAVAVPVAAELAVAPIILYHFGAYSLVSPLANVLAAPLVGLVMLGGVLVLATDWVHPLLGAATGIVAWLPARLIIAIADYTTAPGWGIGQTGPIGWTGVVVAYLALMSVPLTGSLLRLRARLLDADGHARDGTVVTVSPAVGNDRRRPRG